MAATNGYVSVELLREQLNDSANTLSEALLESAINAASRAVDRYTGRRFWTDALVTERTYVPVDPWQAWVDDISTKTGLIIESDTALNGSYSTAWSTSDYQLEPTNQGVVASGDTATAFAWWRIRAIGTKAFLVYGDRATLQVTAKFGWSAIPDDVAQATLIKAVSLFRRKDAPFGVAGFGDLGAVRISRFDPDVVDLLGPYVWPV